MSKRQEILKVVLLGAMTIGTAVTAVQVTRLVRNGLSMEISIDEAQDMANKVNEAREAAIKDITE
jgi:hypothetical protein